MHNGPKRYRRSHPSVRNLWAQKGRGEINFDMGMMMEMETIVAVERKYGRPVTKHDGFIIKIAPDFHGPFLGWLGKHK